MRGLRALLLLGPGCLFAACESPAPQETPDAAGSAAVPDAPALIDTSPLSIRSLGVQGFVLRRGSDVVLTAPLFTRQSAFEVGLNLPLDPDTAAIDAGMSGVPLANIRAIVSGHAHYDHFIDVPHIMSQASNATAYTNLTGRHMLAALAPDRPGCSNAQPTPMLPRSRVIAVDDPLASYVDYTNCPDAKPAGAPLQGRWMPVAGSNVRLMAVCSMHPAQIGPYHFGEGSVDSDQCELPNAASGWKEGLTVAFLIDFLDADGAPAFRVFYQDAPTDAPVGHVPPSILADKRVDVALLCVGSTDSVQNHPGAIVTALAPRFGLSGHWEDFFQDASSMPRPIPLLDLSGYVQRATAALPPPADAALMIDGSPSFNRHVLVQPGTSFDVPLAP
jgi:hypothetical protein